MFQTRFTVALLGAALAALASACESMATTPLGDSGAMGLESAAELHGDEADRAADEAAAKEKAAAAKKKKQAEARKKAAAKRKKDIADKEKRLKKLERELHYAQLELRIERKKEEAEELAADQGVQAAQRALAEAETALSRFTERERPLAVKETALALQRAGFELVEEEKSLAGLITLYAEESEAPSKDDVLNRHREKVRIAELALGVAREKHALQRERGLVDKAAELERAVAAARDALAKATIDREHKRAQLELSVQKKDDALADLQVEFESVERSLKKLRSSD